MQFWPLSFSVLRFDHAGLYTRTRPDLLELLQTASAEIKQLAHEGKCWLPTENEYKMPRYEKPGYANGLPLLARRYCGLWGRGT